MASGQHIQLLSPVEHSGTVLVNAANCYWRRSFL